MPLDAIPAGVGARACPFTVADCLAAAYLARERDSPAEFFAWMAMIERTMGDRSSLPVDAPVLIRPEGAH